jgi:DNA-directed RNA polymerase beta' subunit
VKKRFDPEMFFMEYLLVPPARFRPSQKVGEIETQHSQNVVFAKILERNKDLRYSYYFLMLRKFQESYGR